MSRPYRIRFAGGRKPETHTTLGDAKASILAIWPNAFFYDDDSRVLAWENEERSLSDDGFSAVASITEHLSDY